MNPQNPTSPSINIDSVWLPQANSTLAESVDFGWNAVMWVSVFFFVLLMGMMFTFMWKYRRRSDYDVTSDLDHNARLELLWTVVPLAIVIALFFVGFKGFLYSAVPPKDSYEIQVVGQKWFWTFTYPNGVTSSELIVPEDRPVKLIMSSQDVIHSFFVPEFRAKRDVIPGMYTTLWFEAKDPMVSTMFCTEYCGGGGDGRQGSGHSGMWSRVEVMTGADFDAWLRKKEDEEMNLPPAELGRKLYAEKGCAGCHSLDGTRGNGPSFLGIFGKTEQMASGETITVDENYLRESILQPNARVVAGFAPVMPPFEGQLREKQLTALIEFIKTVK
jgi:cytochrome c oxidase subunit II